MSDVPDERNQAAMDLNQFRVNEFHGPKLEQGLIFGQIGRDRNATIRRVSRFEMTASIAKEPRRWSLPEDRRAQSLYCAAAASVAQYACAAWGAGAQRISTKPPPRYALSQKTGPGIEHECAQARRSSHQGWPATKGLCPIGRNTCVHSE
jgi:hypothetical protein